MSDTPHMTMDELREIVTEIRTLADKLKNAGMATHVTLLNLTREQFDAIELPEEDRVTYSSTDGTPRWNKSNSYEFYRAYISASTVQAPRVEIEAEEAVAHGAHA